MSLADRRGPWGSDPYGRVIRGGGHTAYLEPRAKRIRVEVAETAVADSTRASLLHQPGTPAAWWFPEEGVRMGLLADAGERDQHPPFGAVEHLELRIGDRLVEDLVWRYVEPRADGRRLVGRYSLHHERCRTEVDGRVLDDG